MFPTLCEALYMSCIILNARNSPIQWVLFSLQLIGEETDTEKLSNLLDVTQQVSGGIKGQKHTAWVGNTILNCPHHSTFCSFSTTTDPLLPTGCLSQLAQVNKHLATRI